MKGLGMVERWFLGCQELPSVFQRRKSDEFIGFSN